MHFFREITDAVMEMRFSDIAEYGKCKVNEASVLVKLKSEELYCKLFCQELPADRFGDFTILLREAQMSDEELQQSRDSYSGFVEVEHQEPLTVTIDGDGDEWELIEPELSSAEAEAEDGASA